MRWLAMETSGHEATLAALEASGEGVGVLGQSSLPAGQRTAQALAPALEALLGRLAWSPSSVDLVALTVGPGSFTGLRIGVTAAKTFAYAVGADVLGVNTHDVLAAQAPAGSGPLWTVIDAQRRELFVARYSWSPAGDPLVDAPTCIVPVDRWIAELSLGDTVTGPGLARIQTALAEGTKIVDQHQWQPMAATVGQIAWQRYMAGQRDDLWQLAPHYYRLSAAEEKLRPGD